MNQTVTENHRLRDTIIIGAGLTGLTTAYAGALFNYLDITSLTGKAIGGSQTC